MDYDNENIDFKHWFYMLMKEILPKGIKFILQCTLSSIQINIFIMIIEILFMSIIIIYIILWVIVLILAIKWLGWW